MLSRFGTIHHCGQTDRQTDHGKAKTVAIGDIIRYSDTMSPKNNSNYQYYPNNESNQEQILAQCL